MRKIFNKYGITAMIFLVCIFGLCISSFLFNIRVIGKSMLLTYQDSVPAHAGIKDHIKGIYGVFYCFEKEFNENFKGKKEFINLFGLLQRVMNKRIINDAHAYYTVYKLDTGQITFTTPKYDVTKYVSNMALLKSFLDSRNTKLLFIQAPFKVNKYKCLLPVGIEDTTNLNADNFLSGLRENNVDYLDLREEINNSDLNYADIFYNTDHHWKIDTAFWAYGLISKMLVEKYGFDMKYYEYNTNIRNFNVETLKNSFLGSQGKRVGEYYAGVDDFHLITPKFSTSYKVEVITKTAPLQFSGDFRQSLIREDFLIKDLFAKDMYSTYLGGDHPLTKIINANASGKILIIQDSFGLPFSSFMSLNFGQTDILDLRHFKEMSLIEYLVQNEYDIVFFLYNPSSYGERIMFNFYGQ